MHCTVSSLCSNVYYILQSSVLRAVSACAVKYAVKCALYSKYLCSEVWSQVCSEVYSQVCSIQSSVQLLGIACLCYAVMVLCCIYLLLLMSQLWTWKIIPVWCFILVCTTLVTTLHCTYIKHAKLFDTHACTLSSYATRLTPNYQW